MASSKINKILYTVTITKTISSGYCVVENTKITTSSRVFVQIIRDDANNCISIGWHTYPVISSAGHLNVYVRDAQGALPSDGSKITLNILID